MADTFEWRSDLGAFVGATDRAILSGLITVAELYITDEKRALEHGYTSGNFVTGANVNAVTRDDPEITADGAWIAVGSRSEYALPWEVGHHNLFTRKYERVETWAPTMNENRETYIAAMASEIAAVDKAL